MDITIGNHIAMTITDLNAAAERRRAAAQMTSPHDRAMRRINIENARRRLAEIAWYRKRRTLAARHEELSSIATDHRKRGERLIAEVFEAEARKIERQLLAPIWWN